MIDKTVNFTFWGHTNRLKTHIELFVALNEIAHRVTYMEELWPHLLQLRIVTVTGSNRGVLETRAFLAGPPECQTFWWGTSLMGII